MMQRNVLDDLKKTAAEKPDKIAFSDGEKGLTFAETDAVRDSIGSYLHEKGIYNKPVVVFMQKSPEEVAAFFGVITGGCYYVPIDEEMPEGRIRLILRHVKSPLLICDETTRSRAEEMIKAEALSADIVLYEEIKAHAIRREALEDIRARALDIDPIYIVFTSGSTGIPKGVVACHRSVIDYVEQLSEILAFDENTVFGNQSPLYFDACLKELYPTIRFGATTYLIPRTAFAMPTVLVEYLNTHKINTICWVVSALTMISAFNTFDVVKPEYLRTVAFGSEVFPVRQFNLWKEALPEATFTNLYGPTETTGMCCYYRAEHTFADDEVIPVGKPFPNREIILLKEDNTRAAAGEEGEICIRGNAVTLGYYDDPERTAAAFVQNPLQSLYPETIYRTGDIGRFGEDGNLYFVSRKDYQIKHMGHRVELGEIEVNVDLLESVKMSACVYDAERKKIVLYYVGDTEEKELLKTLKGKLPRYMLPNVIRKTDALPFTANGKIDRRAVLTMYNESVQR